MWIVVACYSWNDVANGGRKPALVLLQPLNGEDFWSSKGSMCGLHGSKVKHPWNTQGH